MDAALRALWVAAAFVVALVALGALATRLTASPDVCASCHEMAPAVATWRTSAHTRAGCPSCHETPRPWYAFPQTLAERAQMLNRDWRASRSSTEAAALRSSLASVTVPDSRCLRCHELSRIVSMRFGTLIKHAEHAKRNKSCVSCHMWTAHREPTAERPLVLMARCFNCHGRTPGAKAPGTCATCHPKSFDLRPDSHKDAAWRTRHGKLAEKDASLCTLCHERGFCNTCHRTPMPHPADWVRGDALHATKALRDPALCARCHTNPASCTACHHRGYDPAKGTWIVQHRTAVTLNGKSSCMQCHAERLCLYCHTTGRLPAGRLTE
jgi:nitrate/TMAO reductase-like tetraheme cytochrome c subunit